MMKCSRSVAVFAIIGASNFMVCAAAGVWDMPVPELKQHAEQGEVDAQLALGRAYEYGKGVQTDAREALRWYEKAAAQGKGVAMRDIGKLYQGGKGVEKNIDEAVRWYQKAIATHEQTFAELELLRLSEAGLTRVKYAGLQVEGGLVLSVLDETTPLDQLVSGLDKHTGERETGKGYWIGYNEYMFSIAARGDAAIPLLVAFAKGHADEKSRHAAALTLHLIGTGSKVTGRFEETFKNRKAREALWELLGLDGMTDDVAMLLKRDPWQADIPAYLRAFQKIQDDCLVALNALDRYAIPDRPIDPLPVYDADREIHFIVPKQYSITDYARIALEAVGKAFPGTTKVEDRLFKDLENENSGLRGNKSSTPVTIKLGDLLVDQLKDLSPHFDYCSAGNAIYYYVEYTSPSDTAYPTLVFCSAHTAKQRWLEWWKREGERRYCFTLDN